MNNNAVRRSEKSYITVVFRYDDYFSLSSTEIESKIMGTFHKYALPCTFGVTPFVCAGDIHDPSLQDVVPLTPLKADMLKNVISANLLEVALHGYSHQTNHLWTHRRFSEFLGLDYQSQEEKISKGKSFLEETLNTTITTFIPPWNTYDLNTVKILEKLGFTCISTYIRRKIKKSRKLKFLPYTCDIHRLRDAVESARCSQDPQPVIVTLFHEYDFMEIDKKRGNLSFQDFDELLAFFSSQKDICVLSINQATRQIDDLGFRRFSYNKPSNIILPFVPAEASDVYLSSKYAFNKKMKRWARAVAFYVAVVVILILIFIKI